MALCRQSSANDIAERMCNNGSARDADAVPRSSISRVASFDIVKARFPLIFLFPPAAGFQPANVRGYVI